MNTQELKSTAHPYWLSLGNFFETVTLALN